VYNMSVEKYTLSRMYGPKVEEVMEDAENYIMEAA